MGSVAEAFAEYRRFYVERYVPKMIEDDPEEGMADFVEQAWDEPFQKLKKLSKADVKALTKKLGPLPEPYVELLTELGVGPLLCSYEDEPIPFHVLKPTQIAKAKQDALSWLSAADAKLALAQGLDPAKLLPFMTDDGRGYYFMLTRRTPDDDAVVIFDHAYETGHPFRKPKPFVTFVARWIAQAKKGGTLNPYDGI